VPFDGAQVSVEVRGTRLRVIRMAGVFDPTTVTRLASVAEAQLAHCSGHIVLDLGEVAFFGTDDVAALVALEEAAAAVGLRLHIAGLAGREPLLPSGISLALARFSMFPTVEHAERELIGRVPLAAPGSAPRSRYVWACPPLSTESSRATSRSGPLQSA
jgi:anti-anti-sigma regulatory factor